MVFLKKILNSNIEHLLEYLESKNIQELIYIFGSKKEIAKRNLIAGIFRGIGFGLGVTSITAVIVYFLQRLVKLNLPIIGKFIHDIVEIVEAFNK